MLQQEFEQRVGIQVSFEEYKSIEVVYMESDLDKGDFCKMWVAMNKKRIAKAKGMRKEAEMKETLKFELSNIAERLRNIKCDYYTFAVDVLKGKEKKLLEMAGISLEESVTSITGNTFTAYKFLPSIQFDIHNYLNR